MYAVIPVTIDFVNLQYTGKSTLLQMWGHFILSNIIKDAGIYQFVKILVLIHAVQESEIHIVRPKRLQLPGKGFFDDVQIPGPAVFSPSSAECSTLSSRKPLYSCVPSVTVA